MASDFSRKTFDRFRHYSGVLMQQGRVQLDADWNEQLDIEQHRTHTETRDVIGESGVPKKGDSFKITAPIAGDLSIAAGHMYVGGLLCELESATTYQTQPYYPNPNMGHFLSSPPTSPASQDPLNAGTYIAYIDAWQREISHLNDPRIREVALGEADTTTRLQTAWQVKLLEIANANANCKSDILEWASLIAPPSGTLNVRTVQNIDPNDPCILPPQSGYRRLENQLYRVEVQRGGTLAQTTFKWSRENGSVETAILAASGNIVTVADVGKDEVLGFAPGQWVEIVDEASALNSSPNPLRQITAPIDPGRREITLSGAPIVMTGGMKLRRWEQMGTADGLPASAVWIDLEGGIQVTFSNGTYRPGDSWLIPARTATGEVEWPPYQVPNSSPMPQLPHGTPHFYCRLALVKVVGGVVSIEDCRPLFLPLTEIEDCDLREHNKHLHGYGVVCGLKMKCLPGRGGVLIEKGYALDCEGNPIRAKHPIPYDILSQPDVQEFLKKENGTGKLCVWVAAGPDNSPVVFAEPYVEQNFWDRVLEGTLLKDFYDECILTIFEFLKANFQTNLNDDTVPEQKQRITSFINLFAQLINTESGPYGFISRKEDDYLRQFYNDLKKLLESETFCGMYDGDDPFPEYKVDDGLDTIFGPTLRFHHRLRLHPNDRFAYTCGTDNKVSVYDLDDGKMVQTTAFPSVPGVVVQDIALDIEGARLFAVCTSGNDSTFAVADIKSDGTLAWGGASAVPGTKYVSLAMGPNDQLFAIAKTQGLHLMHGVGTTGFHQQIWQEFNATGLLHINNSGDRAYAAEFGASGTESPSFDQVRIIGIGGQTHFTTIKMEGVDAANDITSLDDFVFVTGNEANTGERILAGFDRFSGQPLLGGPASIDNKQETYLRLAIYAGKSQQGEERHVLVSNSDRMKVVRVPVNFNGLRMDDTFRIPTQLFPLGIALNSKGDKGYVLNLLVNTLTEMDMAKVFQPAPPNFTIERPEDLANYRDQVIEAYRDVLNHLLQSLKDCFCDKFLVDCPECGEKEKVYLGCVEFKDGKVYHICNFNKRKYVKTFPTVEYWLSTVPILPILREAFGKFCCTVLDIELFGGRKKSGF